jgi:membrane associated rhomboid family serine protease/Zn-finger nucleic acid-binding protein
MYFCPSCDIRLTKTRGSTGIFWTCESCGGRSSTIALLRGRLPRDTVDALWQAAKSGDHAPVRSCPACNHPMPEVPAPDRGGPLRVDLCTVCQFVWFDPGEYREMPLLPQELSYQELLPMETREKLALVEIEKIKKGNDWESDSPPDTWWKWVAAGFGLPVEEETDYLDQTPWATCSLVLLVIAVSIVAFFHNGLESAARQFGLVPAEIGRYGGLTFLTYFFLHGGLAHLLTNMYCLLVYGDNVEDRLGKGHFILLLLCASVVGGFCHALGNPGSTIPCVGANAGISGMATFYVLAFPRARFTCLVFFHKWMRVPAYGMAILWVVSQILVALIAPADGSKQVALWAHLGGGSMGFLAWTLMRIYRSGSPT